MSLPTTNSNGQSSIRNFFQPKSPTYAPPPALSRTQATTAAPPAPPPLAARPPPIPGQDGPKAPPSPAANANTPPQRPPSLHPQATIAPILPEYIPALRRITSLLLPVNYPDSFYQRLSDPLSSGAFSRVLLWSDPADPNGTPKVIGGLVCRPEPSPFAPSSAPAKPNALYIQSLVLLSPYRSLGLAAALLDEIAALAAASPFACEEVYAHVWTDNEDGLRWYLARGFGKHGEVRGYYFKLQPDSAWIVRRQITSTSNPSPSSSIPNSIAATIPPSATAAAANLLAPKPQPPRPTPPILATTATTLSTLSPPLAPPPPRSSGPSPNRSGPSTPGTGTGISYQNARPETEWNDLPADMHLGSSNGGNGNGTSAPGSSAASSRSSSAAPRKKRDRAYPAAAFGK
ncbi:acyl-CoA N-acyltransferase [Annulohypoxylon truncatum]|uniref:acyl-CoA N-acyltransferase n=1 Tax=Annulohypoxylon truncatum TaxID=327061 RepID=UPI0020084F0D|nr:acyl-CoA N-acyltransferase [Annulohypoxylon truncatum]KAI1211947.1 acyl-CoA N-acyltransferase [Annulohypoxylon truncatum]